MHSTCGSPAKNEKHKSIAEAKIHLKCLTHIIRTPLSESVKAERVKISQHNKPKQKTTAATHLVAGSVCGQ